MSHAALLLTTMDEAYGRLRRRSEGLTDAEFSWQPVAGSWTIHPDPNGRWTYDYAIPEPDPAPVTTIGWQLVHLATCKVMYHEWAYGPARLTFPDLDIPHTAAGALAMLDEGHALLRGDLERLSDADLDGPRGHSSGTSWPAWRIFTVMIDHDAFHGGGVLRDIYRWTSSPPANEQPAQ